MTDHDPARHRPGSAAPLTLLVLLVLPGCSGTASDKVAAPAVTKAGGPREPIVTLPPTPLTTRQREIHLLNRLAFGPSPADLERVRRFGPAGWIRRQMRPESVPDAAVEEKLRIFPTLRLTIGELQERYPRPQALAREAGISRDDPRAREKARELVDPERLPRSIARELQAQKLIRAVESERQLLEVLTDFWFNHFNVSIEKGADLWMVTAYEREAIRPHVFGTFRDLLEATASHPAMLWYLDNWQSTRDGLTARELRTGARPRPAPREARFPPNRAQPRTLGLNENYARELLELHTLGVDGGYTQQDVREVARCFTGWSMVPGGLLARRSPLAGKAGTFVFRGAAHDANPKVVLGTRIDAGGIEDGRSVLDLLVSRRETALFVSAKLCRRFVSDAPPATLVTRVAETFLRTKGDLSAVYAEIFSSGEMWSTEAFAAKIKTPLELAASAIRAAGGTTSGNSSLAREVARMGEALYACQPPTGYKETADAWVSPGALVARLNFGLSLSAGRLAGVDLDASALVTDPAGRDASALVETLASRILPVPISETTRETVLAVLSSPEPNAKGERGPPAVSKALGLLLGSPEFQRQ